MPNQFPVMCVHCGDGPVQPGLKQAREWFSVHRLFCAASSHQRRVGSDSREV